MPALKPHLCKCGESNPIHFYKGYKGQCKKCESNYRLIRRGGPKPKRTILCNTCGDSDPSHFYKGYRGSCKKCHRRSADSWKARNKTLISKPGICVDCGSDYTIDINYWRVCRTCYNARGRAKTLSIKKEVFSAYGNRCECCGETEFVFLTIDHIFGDGKQHRKEVGAGDKMYAELRRRGFPKDRYRLLCMNCNFAVRFGQECPHKTTQFTTRESNEL